MLLPVTQGQGSTKGIGDGQVAGWESLATGMARETDVHYYMLGTSSSDAADGMDCASGSGSDCRLVDVWNGSYGSTTGGCSPHSAGVGDNAAPPRPERQSISNSCCLPLGTSLRRRPSPLGAYWTMLATPPHCALS